MVFAVIAMIGIRFLPFVSIARIRCVVSIPSSSGICRSINATSKLLSANWRASRPFFVTVTCGLPCSRLQLPGVDWFCRLRPVKFPRESLLTPSLAPGFCCAGSNNGGQKIKCKSASFPRALSTRSEPPMRCTSSLDIDSPKPVPPNRRVIDESDWTKASKICASFSCEMPIPVSDTETSIRHKHGGSDSIQRKCTMRIFPWLCEFDGIVQQVGNDLAQSNRISNDRSWCRIVDVKINLQALGLCLSSLMRNESCDSFFEFKGNCFRFQVAPLRFSKNRGCR